MSIQYVIVKRDISVGQNPGEKYLPQIVREQPVDLDLIAEQIAGASTMSKADVMGVLQQLQVEMSYHLTRGASVRLGLLGTFMPYLRSKAQLDVDLVKASTFKGLHITFRPSTWLNIKIKNVGYTLVDPDVKGIVQRTTSTQGQNNETTPTTDETNPTTDETNPPQTEDPTT